MKVVIQRVQEASVTINARLHSSVGRGMMILVGIQADDTQEDIEWLAAKICNLRIFNDEAGVMNRSILETDGEILAVSQFTLMARTKKRQPSVVYRCRQTGNFRTPVRTVRRNAVLHLG